MKRNRILVTILMSLTAVCAMAAEPPRTADKSNQALTIPKEATKNADGTYTWTDKQGKTWIYSTGQFGVSRTLETKPSGALPKGIPAGAKLNADGTYAWTDKDGKNWTYVMTPFGASRSLAAAPVAPQPQADVNLAIKVTDKGDTVRFERPGPVGCSVGEKK
jgi:hypothetical protein